MRCLYCFRLILLLYIWLVQCCQRLEIRRLSNVPWHPNPVQFCPANKMKYLIKDLSIAVTNPIEWPKIIALLPCQLFGGTWKVFVSCQMPFHSVVSVWILWRLGHVWAWLRNISSQPTGGSIPKPVLSDLVDGLMTALLVTMCYC